MWMRTGRGVTERSRRLRFDEPDRERRLRESLIDLSTDGARACLFSLSLSRGSELRRSVFSFDLDRTLVPFTGGSLAVAADCLSQLWAGWAGLLLRDRDRERVFVLRLVRERSAPLLDDDEELDDDELLLDELDREPELLREELLSDELSEAKQLTQKREEKRCLHYLPLLSLLLEVRFLRSFSRPRCFLSAFSDSSESDRFFDRVLQRTARIRVTFAATGVHLR